MWDPDQDPMQLAGEYIDFHFKEAAPHITEVMALSHKRYQETLSGDISLKNNYPEGFYATPFTSAVSAAFEKAARAVPHHETLCKEIQREEAFFIYDWMEHPAYTRLDDHADQKALFAWVASMPKPPAEIRLVHGEPQAKKALAEKLSAATEQTTIISQ